MRSLGCCLGVEHCFLLLGYFSSFLYIRGITESTEAAVMSLGSRSTNWKRRKMTDFFQSWRICCCFSHSVASIGRLSSIKTSAKQNRTQRCLQMWQRTRVKSHQQRLLDENDGLINAPVRVFLRLLAVWSRVLTDADGGTMMKELWQLKKCWLCVLTDG